MTAPWLLAALIAEVVSFLALAQAQRQMLSAAGTRPRLRAVVGLTLEANAINVTLPGGTALAAQYSLRRMRAWGASGGAATFAVLASGVVSLLAFTGLALVWATTAGGGGALAAVAPAVLALAALTQRDRLLSWAMALVRRANRWRRRPLDAGLARLAGFRQQLRAVRPDRRHWWRAFGHAGLNWVADLGCLVACCAAVGVHPGRLSLVLGAYLAGMSVSSLSFLPAGLGATEAAMIAALGGGGLSPGAASCGVLCYRALSVGLVVTVGWLLWLRTRRSGNAGRRVLTRRPVPRDQPSVNAVSSTKKDVASEESSVPVHLMVTVEPA
jgi:uncharacterized membrane protein YbhN (UPF0104 family)